MKMVLNHSHNSTSHSQILPVSSHSKPFSTENRPYQANSRVKLPEEIRSTHEKASQSRRNKGVSSSVNLAKKPKWALTEKQLDELEQQECNNLLNFADKLNFEEFLYDIEVRSMVSALKARIDEIKQQENEALRASQQQQQEGLPMHEELSPTKPNLVYVEDRRTNPGRTVQSTKPLERAMFIDAF